MITKVSYRFPTVVSNRKKVLTRFWHIAKVLLPGCKKKKQSNLDLTRKGEVVKRVIAVMLCILFVGSIAAYAGPNADAKVSLHVLPHDTRSCTKNFPAISSCSEIIVTEASSGVDVFPVFFDLAELGGCEYSLTWPGAYTCAFTSCSDLTIGGIVDSGDGISHAWSTCQTEDFVITGWGWFEFFVATRLCVAKHPAPEIDGVQVGDCTPRPNTELDILPPDNYGCAGINGETGDDPCELAVSPATWSQIKSMYK